MRPCVRSASLDGYVGLARSLRPRPGRPDRGRRAGHRRPRRPREVDPGRGGRAPAASSRPTGPGCEDFGAAAGRPPPAVDPRPAQRRAAPGAGPAQRAGTAGRLRAQLQRGAAAAAGGGRRPGHHPAVDRVRRARCRPGRRWSWPRRRCSGSSGSCWARSGSRCRSASPTGARRRSPPTCATFGPRLQFDQPFTGLRLLRRPARRPEHGVRSAAAALRAAVPGVAALTAGRDGVRPGAGGGRGAAAARPLLDRCRWPAAWG